ncbi:nucleotide excision repair endonuclease [Paenibacillus sp. FSL K6-3166]|uniref:nucleotide excision repair endonuclease n=1 Tax=unclassified Paenibacillus TaxID=185978 RepID=UPI000B9FE8F1|nr:nucleotide excision repair endonuclease [Paenibacillus sp. VTT E-133291]OZQ84712.1 hypothetical protein CA598_23245 [Paenibacillus sp. VTT E-133291]
MGITVTLPESVSHTKEEFERHRLWLSGVSGVYVLRDIEGACLYVGKSTNLWTRVSSHIKGHQDSIRFYKQIHSITLYQSGSQFEVDIYETYLINELMPKYNRDKMFFAGHIGELSDALELIDERLHYLREDRAGLLLAIARSEDFAEDEFGDERVIRFEEAANASQLREVERKIHNLTEERWRTRGKLTIAGGVSA